VAQNRIRSGGTSWVRRMAAYSSRAAKALSRASGCRAPVASTPWPSRTIRLSRTRTSGRSPTNSLMVLVPQSIAAIGAPTSLPRGRGVAAGLHAGPVGPPLAEQVEHLVTEGVHTSTLGQRLTGEHVEALDAVGHPAGRDALDLGDVESGGGPDLGARGQVALVGRTVGRSQVGVGAQPGLHLFHHAAALEGADPRG